MHTFSKPEKEIIYIVNELGKNGANKSTKNDRSFSTSAYKRHIFEFESR